MHSKAMKRVARGLYVGAVAGILAACGGSPAGDAAHGKELYAQCSACHQLAVNSTGPMHCGLFGRRAGTVPGFDYSEAMKASDILWSADTLDEFLTSPISYVDGTRMGFAGFDNPADRADVIAYLQQVNGDQSVCPRP